MLLRETRQGWVSHLGSVQTRALGVDYSYKSAEIRLIAHEGAYNRIFPCMEATYPLCHKEPARSKQNTLCVPKPLVGGFGCDELVLYGIRELA